MKYLTTSELTKLHMAENLQALMLEKPINKITIKELTSRCKINRQTFYYHFCDIYDLLEWLLRNRLKSIATNIENFDSWQEAGIYLLDYLCDNRPLVLSTLNSLSRNSVHDLIHDEIFKLASKFVHEIAGDIKLSENAFKHIIHFFCITFTALLEDWLVSDSNQSSKEVIYDLDMIVSGMTRNAVLRYALKEEAL